MKVLLIDDHGKDFDCIEWDDKTVIELADARGLLAKMVAQSIQDFAAIKQAQQSHDLTKFARAKAMEEVVDEKGGFDDIPY